MSAKSGSAGSGREQPLLTSLRALHLQAGQPSARAMAAAIGNVSHTTVAETLNGKRIPSWPIVRSIIDNLGGDTAEVHALWISAVETSSTGAKGSPKDDDFVVRYRRQAAAHHGHLAIPDPGRRHIVGIDTLFITPNVTSFGSGEVHRLDLESIFDESPRVVLLGPAGSGKSAVCSWLMHQQAADYKGRIPFLVSLHELAGESGPNHSIVSFIELYLETALQCPAPQGAISQLLMQGNALVIFDGLDEVGNTLRRVSITSAIESFCNNFPHAQVLVTSRPAGYYQAQLNPDVFAIYQLQDFDDTQVKEYAHRWFFRTRSAGSVQKTVNLPNTFLQETENLADVRSTPLLLAMICAVYQETGATPRSLPELYERTTQLLLDRHSLHLQPFRDPRKQHLLTPLLRHIAFWLFSENGTQLTVSEDQLVAETTRYLSTRLEEQGDVDGLAQELLGFLRERSSILREISISPQGEQQYAFTHLTLLEYFAATHLVATADSPEQLALQLVHKVEHERWTFVSRLTLQIIDRQIERGGERIIRTWLDQLDVMNPDERLAWQKFLIQCPELVYLPPSLTGAIAQIGGQQQSTVTNTDKSSRSQANESNFVGYRGPAACQIAGITYRQLDYWARTGLVTPSLSSAHDTGLARLYSFTDILILKITKRLLDTGVLLENIKVAIDHLRRQGIRDLAKVTLFSDGTEIYECTSPEEIVDLLQRGQGVFGIAVSGAMQEINGIIHKFPAERADGTAAFVHESNPEQGNTSPELPPVARTPCPSNGGKLS